ncbi:unnamed protein product [Closterium sp. NIES-53]
MVESIPFHILLAPRSSSLSHLDILIIFFFLLIASFGVVMLTIITARKAVWNLESNLVNLKAWVEPLVAAKDVATFKDPYLEAPDTMVLRLARLALSCTTMPTASRPSMSRILGE